MIKILIGEQIRNADRITMEREPISSIDLMERASQNIAQWFMNHVDRETPLVFCIGKGNNGGDGLAVARLLHEAGSVCSVSLAFPPEEMSVECRYNYDRLPREVIRFASGDIPEFPADSVIVDALLGTGVKGAVREPLRSLIARIRASGCRVISIDLPSGLPTEWGGEETSAVEAETTLALEFPKLSLLLPATGEFVGNLELLPIGLDKRYMQACDSPYYLVTKEDIERLRVPRRRYAYKNQYGHLLLVCGSRRMMGAAVLAAGGALRSGCGLVTAHVPEQERVAIQLSCPSALSSLDPGVCFSTLPEELENYSAIGIGSGLGRAPETVRAFGMLLQAACEQGKPMVLDADALNMLAADERLRACVPAGSLLTPHVGELRRCVGDWTDDREKFGKTLELARELRSVVLIKGAYTAICTPDGRVMFNPTGTPGMAKAGSGDVLTGLAAGLLARGYDAVSAALIAVWKHGEAGEKAAACYGVESMNSSDLVRFLKL